MFDLPGYVWVLILVGTVGIPALTCVVLYRGAVGAGLRRRTAWLVAGVTAVVWAGWILISVLLADGGTYRQSSTATVPWIGVVAVGSAVVALLATRIPVVARILDEPGMAARLALPQTVRAIGVVFLVVFAMGKLPAVFALPAGLGDIAVGVSAPFVARRLAAGGHRRGAVWFNIMGLVDLVVAMTIGFLAGLGATQILPVTPSTAALTLLPLALVPSTAVPFAAALHVVSLAKLRTASRAADQTGPTTRSVSAVHQG
jgi:hypothetical protein